MAEYNDEAHPELSEERLQQLLNSSNAPTTSQVPLTSLSDIFKVPENLQYQYGKFSEDFEKYKVKVDVLKWLIGTVGLTVITFIINWGFRDREQGMNEISQYDKYATEIIVLNDNPVKKRMLAQFFARVTPSEKLKKGWNDYYKDVNEEYTAFIKQATETKKRLEKLTMIDSSKLNLATKNEIEKLQEEDRQNEEIINAPTIVPDISSNFEGKIKIVNSSYFEKTDPANSDVELAKEYEDKGFSYLVEKDVNNAIKSFTQSENSVNQYHMVYDIAKYLKENKNILVSQDPKTWKQVYSTILEEYSWRMPQKYKVKFIELSK